MANVAVQYSGAKQSGQVIDTTSLAQGLTKISSKLNFKPKLSTATGHLRMSFVSFGTEKRDIFSQYDPSVLTTHFQFLKYFVEPFKQPLKYQKRLKVL